MNTKGTPSIFSIFHIHGKQTDVAFCTSLQAMLKKNAFFKTEMSFIITSL